MTDEELAAIESLCEKTSPLPWVKLTSRDVFSCVIAPGVSVICMDCENDADADFIAASRTEVPRLLAEVKRLQSERRLAVDVLREILASCQIGILARAMIDQLIEDLSR